VPAHLLADLQDLLMLSPPDIADVYSAYAAASARLITHLLQQKQKPSWPSLFSSQHMLTCAERALTYYSTTASSA
jgi:hypothetical protein